MDILSDLIKELPRKRASPDHNDLLARQPPETLDTGTTSEIDMQHTTTLGGTTSVSKSLYFGDDLDMLLCFPSIPSRVLRLEAAPLPVPHHS